MFSDFICGFMVGIGVFILLAPPVAIVWLYIVLARQIRAECNEKADEMEITKKTYERLLSFEKHSRSFWFETCESTVILCMKTYDKIFKGDESVVSVKKEATGEEAQYITPDAFKKEIADNEWQLIETKYLSQKLPHTPIDDNDFPIYENNLVLCEASRSQLAMYGMTTVENHCSSHKHCFLCNYAMSPLIPTVAKKDKTVEEDAEKYKAVMRGKEWQSIEKYLERKEAHMPIDLRDFTFADGALYLTGATWKKLLKYSMGIVAGHCTEHKYCFLYGHNHANPHKKEEKKEDEKTAECILF